MTDMIHYALLAAAFAVLVFGAWELVCNNRTARQRRALIDYAFKQRDWRRFSRLYDDVSYNAHMWALICFRDPRRLYDASLWPAFEGKS